MNVLFHFLFNYVIIELVYGNARDYIIYILFFSTIIDLDHIGYIIKTIMNKKKIVKGEIWFKIKNTIS